MTREIKFRAWDKDCCRFEYFEIGENDDCYGMFRVSANKFGSIIEQYTGLKDKNGKEIYEGDIVTVQDEDIPFALVNAIATNRWLVRFGKHRAAFTLVKKTRRRNFIRTFQHIKQEDVEVVGNIHENLECQELKNE